MDLIISNLEKTFGTTIEYAKLGMSLKLLS